MERITSENWKNADLHEICGQGYNCAGRCEDCLATRFFIRAARYEDTGLMPEEITDCRWIPVTERLPEDGTPVLVNYLGNNDGKMHPDGVAVWTDYGCLWWEGSLEDCDTEVTVPITHWMPLPKAPEVE